MLRKYVVDVRNWCHRQNARAAGHVVILEEVDVGVRPWGKSTIQGLSRGTRARGEA